jgi:hypothetical protein
MIWEYLVGKLSVLLEKLQAATSPPADDLVRLRRQVEDASGDRAAAGRLAMHQGCRPALLRVTARWLVAPGDSGMPGETGPSFGVC